MKALLQLFDLFPGKPPAALMPEPMDLTSAELHTISLALARWAAENPGMPTVKTAAFKIDAVRGAWARKVREQS